MAHTIFQAKRSLLPGCALSTSLDPSLGAVCQRNSALRVYLAIQAPLFREAMIMHHHNKVFPKSQRGVLGGKHHLSCKAKFTTELFLR